MRLFLIRHGESVDNVAGLYAGSRDSPLTNHGVLQTRRLGSHLASRQDIGTITHIFASNLQRAFRTAEAIAEAVKSKADAEVIAADLTVQRLPELREKDFGSDEGKRFGTRDKSALSLSDSETPEHMKIRINRFVDSYLLPLLTAKSSENETVVVVAHGIILNVLLKTLQARFPGGAANPGSQGPAAALAEWGAAWSNTGYLEAVIEYPPKPKITEYQDTAVSEGRPVDELDKVASVLCSSSTSSIARTAWKLVVLGVNKVDHLQGLKKTRGGIGSAQFDTKQRTMDSFFKPTTKKRKAGQDDVGG